MTAVFSRTPDEYLAWMSDHAPHAIVLRSWARVERALDDYARRFAVTPPSQSRTWFDNFLSSPDRVGPELARSISRLREQHDKVAAHRESVSPDDAKAYAARTIELVAALDRRQDERVGGPRDEQSRMPATRWWKPGWTTQR